MNAVKNLSGQPNTSVSNQIETQPDSVQLHGTFFNSDLGTMMKKAASLRDFGHGSVISYSRKVFIPLTKLCRDVCHYCTFAKTPKKNHRAYLTVDEILKIAEKGRKAGCKEALFTLGDKPEKRYASARSELNSMGHSTTISYLLLLAIST